MSILHRHSHPRSPFLRAYNGAVNDSGHDWDEFPEPTAFDRVDDREDDARRDSSGALRGVVWIVSAIVMIALVGLPLLRAIDARGDGRGESADAGARSRVAAQFAFAALDERSAPRAARWALPTLEQRIAAIVAFLQSLGDDSLEGAETALASVACGADAARERECFHAWLGRPGGPELIRLRFIVETVDGEATVVALRTLGRVAAR